jgi:hypothetical protein
MHSVFYGKSGVTLAKSSSKVGFTFFLMMGHLWGAPVRPVDVLLLRLALPPSVEAFAATLGVSSSSLSCTFISGLCSPMITFFSLDFFVDPAELSLLDCLTQEYLSERDYDRLA